jgi:hypothetical protein
MAGLKPTFIPLKWPETLQSQTSQPPKRLKPAAWLARSGRDFLVLGGFLVVAIAFTWPLVLHFASSVPGDPTGDNWQMVWNLWWVREALTHFQNPFHTDLIFYPQGTGLYLHALNALNGFVSLPVQLGVAAFSTAANGAIAGYNFIVLLSFTFAAYGAFCLARYLWRSERAALLAGLAYGFSTYGFDHLLGHLNLISYELIPFYLLFLLKALHKKGRAALLSWQTFKLVVPPVLCLLGLLLLELQYVLYMAFFSLFYLLYLAGLWGWKRLRHLPTPFNLGKIYRRAVLIGLGFAVLSLPLTIPMLNEALNNPNTVPLRQENSYSADLLAYFYPSPFHPLWGDAMQRAIKPFTATLIEKVVFPGFTVYLLILAGFGVWLCRRFLTGRNGSKETLQPPNIEETGPTLRLRDRSPRDRLDRDWSPGPVFWLVIAAIFAVLSFGPRLHINGVEHGPALPGALIYELPILNITRVPARFAIVAILGLALVAAWGLSRLENAWPRHRRVANALTGLALLALGFELLPAPYPLAPYEVSPFYHMLAAQPGSDYSIMEVPLNFGKYQYTTNYLEAQMTHGKPDLNGYISRNPVFAPYYGVPVFREFRDFEGSPPPDILPAQTPDAGILRYFGVRYIVIRKDMLAGKEEANSFDMVSQVLPGRQPVFDSPDLAAFEVPPGPEAAFFYNLVLPSWYAAEKGPDGLYSRWVQGSQAQLDFWTGTPRQLEISFPAWGFQQSHAVEFRLNGQAVGQAQVTPAPQTVVVKLSLQPGRNRLEFNISGPGIRPADVSGGNDTRSLSINIGEISLKS